MPVRDASIDTLTLTANVENSIAIPAGTVSIEMKPRTDADIRMAYIAGDTADNHKYWTVNPDWWSELGFKLPAGKLIYFRCAVNNILEFHFGIE